MQRFIEIITKLPVVQWLIPYLIDNIVNSLSAKNFMSIYEQELKSLNILDRFVHSFAYTSVHLLKGIGEFTLKSIRSFDLMFVLFVKIAFAYRGLIYYIKIILLVLKQINNIIL